jgi:hypothetical protein
MNDSAAPRKKWEHFSKKEGPWEDLEGERRMLFGGMLQIRNWKEAARNRECWRK